MPRYTNELGDRAGLKTNGSVKGEGSGAGQVTPSLLGGTGLGGSLSVQQKQLTVAQLSIRKLLGYRQGDQPSGLPGGEGFSRMQDCQC